MDVSIPMDEIESKVSSMLIDDIKSGKYDIGEMFVPEEFEITSVKNGKLRKEKIVVKGRKRKLSSIRAKMFNTQKPFLRTRNWGNYEDMSRSEIIAALEDVTELKPEDKLLDLTFLREKLWKLHHTRNLMIWHDGATLVNHSHILFMVATIYDPILFLTDKEYYDKSGKIINVQAIVEKPELYILARCPATDQQLSYVDTRIQDLNDLTEPIEIDNYLLFDSLRFFKGDGPASQFEAGQQKGGNYKCWACGIHVKNNSDYTFSRYLPLVSYEDRRSIVMRTNQSQTLSLKKQVKIFSSLSKSDIIEELH